MRAQTDNSQLTTLNSHRGFTLLELLFVCVIILLVIGAVVPSLGGFMGRMRLQSTMQRLASLAVFARSQALTIGRPVAMEVNQSAQEVTLLQQAEGQAEGFTPLGAQWRLRMPESVSMSALEIDGASAQTAGAGQTASPLKSSESPEGRITFYPDGSAQAGCVTLALRSEGGQAGAKRLCVNKVTGRVRVQ